jgi:hypothetical protein
MRAVAASVAVIVSVLVASGCASSGKKPTTSVRSTALGPAGTGTLSRNHALRVARASNPAFSIFPAKPGKRHCVIPLSTMALRAAYRGTCQTSVRRYQPAQMPAVMVTFTERWQLPECAPDLDVACPHPWRRHIWQVIEGEPLVKLNAGPGPPARRVIRSSGATAPQDYK